MLWQQILKSAGQSLTQGAGNVVPLWKKILQPKQPQQPQQPTQSVQKTTDTLLPSTQSIAPLWQRILNQDIYKPGTPPAQARQSARMLGEEVRQKVGQPFATGAMQTFQKTGEKTMEIMNPGSSYLTPQLEKYGVNPTIAFGVGLGVDILAPGPGEFSKLSKLDDLKPLMQEATKYKTADEFVKAQGDEGKIAFHGTQAKEIRGVPNKTKGTIGNAFYLSGDAVKAEQFGKDATVKTMTNELKRRANIYPSANTYAFDISNLKIKTFNNDAEFFNYVKDPDIEKWMRLSGYDGVYMKDTNNYAIYNTEKLQNLGTKSRLTDIYKKAHTGIK